MTLAQYMDANGLSQTEFARAAGCTQAQISRILNGKREPSKALARKISQATGGKISEMALLYPDAK